MLASAVGVSSPDIRAVRSSDARAVVIDSLWGSFLSARVHSQYILGGSLVYSAYICSMRCLTFTRGRREGSKRILHSLRPVAVVIILLLDMLKPRDLCISASPLFGGQVR